MITKTEYIKSDGVPIYCELRLPDTRKPYPAVCVCHGIPARLPDPGDRGYPLLAERICREGFASLIFNFRGAGASGGNFDMLGWAQDLERAIDYLCDNENVDRSRLDLLGFSGGAATAIYVAARDSRVSSLISCSAPAEFTSFTLNNAKTLIDHFRSVGIIKDADFPHSVPEWLASFRQVSPINYISRIAPRPLLILHGGKDETVNVNDAHRLYAAALQPKKINIIDGAGHRLRQDERAITGIIEWLHFENRCEN